jgi:hypothetical protein
MTAPGTQAGGERPQESGRTDRLMNDAKDKGRELAGQARSTLSDTAEKTRTAANTAVDRGTTKVATDARRIASAFRTTTDNLRGQGQGALAGAGDQVANAVERLADYLERADGATLQRDVGNFVRRQPALALAGLFAVGFVASRFMKSSEPRSESDGDYYGRRQLTSGYGDSYGAEAGYGTGASYGSTAGSYGTGGSYGTAAGTGGAGMGGSTGSSSSRSAGGTMGGGTAAGGLSAGGTSAGGDDSTLGRSRGSTPGGSNG